MAIKKIPKYKIKDTDYVPLSKAQKLLMQRDFENVFDVCLLGASGVGKTVALIISSMGPQKDGSFLTDRSEYRCIFLRRESTLLSRAGLLDAAYMWYKRFYQTVEFNKVEKTFTFPSGAKIAFGGVEQDSDKEKYKGYTELHCVCWEELTQFSQAQYDFICSRLRTKTNIPLRVRSSTNPGDREEQWVMNRYKYWITKFAEPVDRDFEAKWGEVLYYHADLDGVVISRKKPDDVHFSFCGIETYVNDIKKDNDKFMAAQITDPVLRAQLVDGVWGLKAGAGMYFSKEDFFESTVKAPAWAVRIRYWDKACSGPKGDYLAGCLMAHYVEDGISKLLIEHMILEKPEVSKVKAIINYTAQKDGKDVYIGFEQEPGSSGKELMDDYNRDLSRQGFKVIVDNKRKSKLDRATLLSPLTKDHRVGFIHCEASNEMFKQLVGFPTKGLHDDACDTVSGASYLLLNQMPKPQQFKRAPMSTNTKDLHSMYSRLEYHSQV